LIQRKSVPFDWSDAWVFASMKMAQDESGAIDFSLLIAHGDLLNHAILTDTEIRAAMQKFHSYGLIELTDANIGPTEIALGIYAKSEKKRGGLFSVVDNTLSVLNSPKTKLSVLREEPADMAFVNASLIDESYKRYRHRSKDAP
jgi:hypothetical protein